VKRVYHNGSKAPTAIWKAFLKAAKTVDEVIFVDKNPNHRLLCSE
jgi:hypothetical protein